jgi:hypothetical protein
MGWVSMLEGNEGGTMTEEVTFCCVTDLFFSEFSGVWLWENVFRNMENCNLFWFVFLFGGRGGFGDVERKRNVD